MGTEKKNGAEAKTEISRSLKKQLIRHCKQNNTSQAQVLRDLIQGLFKRK